MEGQHPGTIGLVNAWKASISCQSVDEVLAALLLGKQQGMDGTDPWPLTTCVGDLEGIPGIWLGLEQSPVIVNIWAVDETPSTHLLLADLSNNL